MRYLFSLLLLCLIFENALTTRRSLKMKMAKVVKVMHEISRIKEKKIRKLDGTDSGDSDSGSETVEATTPPTEEYVQTGEDEAESGNATAANAPVSATKPVATKPKSSTKKDAAVQVTKFHGFKASGTKKISFGVYFYFFGRSIVKYIIMRLRLSYGGRLRNLQTATAESARTDCTIANPDLAGTTSTEGANVNYNCEATTTEDASKVSNVTLNTDIPMTMVEANGTSSTMSFDDVNFNGDAANEASNIQNNDKELSNVYTLEDSIVTIEKNVILIITGMLRQSTRRLRNLALSNGQEITMKLSDDDGNPKSYDCTFNGAVNTESKITCDTTGNLIETNSDQLQSSPGNSSDSLITLEMKNFGLNSTEAIKTTGSSHSRYTYSRSSSGLSGGAIAGIVIACVVALAAASIAAIMLRKPTPPVENTTMVDLKNENI